MTSKTPWEDTCLYWFRRDPQAFLDVFFHGQVRFCHELPRELETQKYKVDALLEVEIVGTGERILIHIEFQTYYDPTMAERMLVYNVNTLMKYGKPVLSIVLHLMDDTPIAPAPRVWSVPVSSTQTIWTLASNYIVVELGQMTPQQLRDLDHLILLPLLPLTDGGTEREEIEAMFQSLSNCELTNLQVVGLAFATLKLEREDPAELEWLRGRFYNTMLEDVQELLLQSPFFQWVIEDMTKEREARGEARGEAKGKAEVLAQIVRARFPELAALCQQQLAGCTDQEHLGDLAVKLALAQHMEEAQEALLALPSEPGRMRHLPPA